MLKFKVEGQNIVLADKTPLGFPMVSGTIGEYDCQFEFDESWNGYGKTAYFMNIGGRSCMGKKNKKTKKIIPIPLGVDNKCKVPVEILEPETFVRIGVGGVKNEHVRPTVYSTPMLVRLGAKGDEDIPCPDSDTYDHIIQIVEETKEIAQSVRDDANAGKFNGKDGKDGKDGGVNYATFDIDVFTGLLEMFYSEDYDTESVNFEINKEGYLEVIINA